MTRRRRCAAGRRAPAAGRIDLTAWRNVAAARVREGDLSGAIAAYRETDKRAR
jgi:hypothetical protein